MKITIFGGGSFATALARLISWKDVQVMILTRNKKVVESINEVERNDVYFPFLKLNPNIKADFLDNASNHVVESEMVLFGLPSSVTRETARKYKRELKYKWIVSTAKGLEYPGGRFMSEVIQEETDSSQVVSFSGPTFADEIIQNHPSGVTMGFGDESQYEVIKKYLELENIIFDFSPDVRGVEMCGVLKNTYAVAMGIMDSHSSGYNQHYTFLNMCFNEMRGILDAFSKDGELIFRFCGFGDFNLTANSDKSRNRTLGIIVGRSILDPKEVSSSIVFEGLKSTKAVREKCRALEVQTPIVDFVNDSLEDIRSIPRKVKDFWQASRQ